MLKDTETEETIGIAVVIFIIGGISIGEWASHPALLPWLHLWHGHYT